MIVWIIGLSGAGKTTVGREVYERWNAHDPATVLLDGDQVREVMGDDLGHTVEDRKRNADRMNRLCRVLDDQGINVVCCILSVFESSRAWNRANLSEYLEVFLDVPMDVLVDRDPKGLYEGALEGEIEHVVGVDIEFEPPEDPDLVLRNDEELDDPTVLADRILERIPLEDAP